MASARIAASIAAFLTEWFIDSLPGTLPGSTSERDPVCDDRIGAKARGVTPNAHGTLGHSGDLKASEVIDRHRKCLTAVAHLYHCGLRWNNLSHNVSSIEDVHFKHKAARRERQLPS